MSSQRPKSGEAFQPLTLVQSCLSPEGLAGYEEALGWSTDSSAIARHAIEQALEAEAKRTAFNGAWSSLPQICALASVVEADINVVYPDVNLMFKPFSHTTVKSLSKSSKPPISIMWSATTPPGTTEGLVRLNHFVPLLKPESLRVSAKKGAAKDVKMPTRHKPRQLTLGDFLVPNSSKAGKPKDSKAGKIRKQDAPALMKSAGHVTSSFGNISSKRSLVMDDGQRLELSNDQSTAAHVANITFQNSDSKEPVEVNIPPQKHSSATTATEPPPKKARRQVSAATFKKWQSQYDREHQTLSWLQCYMDSKAKNMVDSLWCKV